VVRTVNDTDLPVPWLAVDLGNTRLKLALWDRARAQAASAVALPSRAESLDELASWLARAPRPAAAALASVGAADLEDDVLRRLRAAVDGPVIAGPDAGLSIELQAPERVGRDRLYAARGARERLGRSAIVVDAGTALTVDALVVESDGRARFLGGAIAPGPDLWAQALAARGARLPLVVPEPGAPALGRDTEGALRGGIAVGFRGAARELVRRVAREAGLDGAPVVLTGGARGFLLGPAFAEGPLEVEPDLVVRGLMAALGDALARSPARGAAQP
jgi:type III pantothenate kinase